MSYTKGTTVEFKDGQFFTIIDTLRKRNYKVHTLRETSVFRAGMSMGEKIVILKAKALRKLEK